MNAAFTTFACLILAGTAVWALVIHRAVFRFLDLIP